MQRAHRGSTFLASVEANPQNALCGEGWTGSEGSGEEVGSLEHQGEGDGMRILGTTDLFPAR